MVDLTALASELTVNPLSRAAYAGTDQAATDDLNTSYRDKTVTSGDILAYMVATRTHTNQGQDTAANNTTPTNLLGRLIHAAEQVVLEAALPIDVFGAGGTKAIDSTRELHSCKAFLEILRNPSSPASLLTDTEPGNILSDLVNAGVMNTAQKDDIVALSTAKQSRAQELSLGTVLVGHVTMARAA